MTLAMGTSIGSDDKLEVSNTAQSAVEATEVSNENYAALIARIYTDDLWKDRAVMLPFLSKIFSSFPEYKSLERRLNIDVGGDTPQVLLEECILQMWKNVSVQNMFGTLENLRQCVIFARKKNIPCSFNATAYSSQNTLDVNTSRDFFLQNVLGKGGQATVYKAVHNGEVIALKKSDGELDKEFVCRAERERKAGMILNKIPGVVRIHGSGFVEGAVLMAMEYMDAGSLKQFINAESIHNTQYQQLGTVWFYNVCKTFSKMHPGNTTGITPIVHRDIKADNFLINSQGELKIADFGLALINENHSVTQQGGMLGTVTHMAPEILGAGMLDADEKIDVYALGITMYYYFAGKRPIEITVARDLFKHATDSIDFSALPNKDLAYIIEQMLKKDPSQRCTMTEAANALQHLFATNLFTRAQQVEYNQRLTEVDYLSLDPSLQYFLTNELAACKKSSTQEFDLPMQHTQNVPANNPFEATIAIGTHPGLDVTIVPNSQGPNEIIDSTVPLEAIIPQGIEQLDVTIVPLNNPISVEENQVKVGPVTGVLRGILDEDTSFTLSADVVGMSKTTEQLITEIFTKLEQHEFVGRTSLRRIQALAMSNKLATGLVLVGSVILATTIGIGAVKASSYNAAVATVNQTRDDLAELLKRPTKIAANDWQPIITKYNVVNDIDGNEADDRLLQVLAQANTNNQYTIEANEHGDIASIVPTVDIRTQELHTQIAEVAKRLNGTAQAIDDIRLDAINTAFATILTTPFVISEAEVVASLQSLVPEEYQIVSNNGVLQVQHKIEQADVQAIIACYGRLSDALRKEDNPSMPAVVTVLAELNVLRTNWIHRSGVLQACDSTGMTTLPSFIVSELFDEKLVVSNKAYSLEDGANVIESRFGKFSIKNNVICNIEFEGVVIDFTKEITATFRRGEDFCLQESRIQKTTYDVLSRIPGDNLTRANLPKVNYFSLNLPGDKFILFTNKVQGFYLINKNNIEYIENITELYNADLLINIVRMYNLNISIDDLHFVTKEKNPEDSISEFNKAILYAFQYPNFRDVKYVEGDYLYDRCFKIVYGNKTPEEVLGLPLKEPTPADQVQNTSGGGNN
jgi:serine/threonine protein kinase